MKTLLTSLLLICGMNLSAQTTDTCKRASIVFNGYTADSAYVVTITNLSDCPSNYYLRDPAGNFYPPPAIFIAPHSSKTISFKSVITCGKMSILPDEQCKNFGFMCPLDYIYTERDVCSTLPIPSTNFFPVQKGNTITGTIDLTVPPKDSDKFEMEMLLENGTTIKKTVKLIHVSGDRYYFTTMVN